MNTQFRFIILVPHRDAGNLLNKYREKIFASGFYGACSFPLAAPLARVSKPFSGEELKELARNIRSLTKDTDGRILSTGTALVRCSGHPQAVGQEGADSTATNFEQMSFFGPLLNLPAEEGIFPPPARAKILMSFLPPILCASLVAPEVSPMRGEFPAQEEALSFRAAALANLVIRPLASGDPNYSLEWKMGPLIWLPAFKRD